MNVQDFVMYSSSWSSLKPWWCCQWCVQIIFVESQALRVGSAQCCFSTLLSDYLDLSMYLVKAVFQVQF